MVVPNLTARRAWDSVRGSTPGGAVVVFEQDRDRSSKIAGDGAAKGE
jgi:hypothetical protein